MVLPADLQQQQESLKASQVSRMEPPSGLPPVEIIANSSLWNFL